MVVATNANGAVGVETVLRDLVAVVNVHLRRLRKFECDWLVKNYGISRISYPP